MLRNSPEAIWSLELPADTQIESPVLCEILAGHLESEGAHRCGNDDSGTHRHTGAVLVEEKSWFARHVLLGIEISAGIQEHLTLENADEGEAVLDRELTERLCNGKIAVVPASDGIGSTHTERLIGRNFTDVCSTFHLYADGLWTFSLLTGFRPATLMNFQPVDWEKFGETASELVERGRIFIHSEKLLRTECQKIAAGWISGVVEGVVSRGQTHPHQEIAVSAIERNTDNIFVPYTTIFEIVC